MLMRPALTAVRTELGVPVHEYVICCDWCPRTIKAHVEADVCWYTDTCRWMSGSYERVDGKTAVTRQPETPAERERALHALLSCPTCGSWYLSQSLWALRDQSRLSTDRRRWQNNHV